MDGLFLPTDFPGSRQWHPTREPGGWRASSPPSGCSFFLCFPRTRLVLHIRLFHFMFQHCPLPKPADQGCWRGWVSLCHSLLPFLASLQDQGMFILPVPFAVYHISSITCSAFPNFYCSLPHSFPWLFANTPASLKICFLILCLSKLLKQNTSEWLTLIYRSKKKKDFFFNYYYYY